MVVVGLTGSLASGKTAVAGLFKKHGAKVFDADAAAKKAVGRNTPVYKAIRKIFGREYLTPSGALDRRKLAAWVFRHPRDLHKLNVLIHPGVIVECFKVIERFRKYKGILVLDVPLLFESKMEHLADWTVVVVSSREKMLKRAVRKGIAADLARKILSTQWSLKRKARLADFVIQNNGSVKNLEKQVLVVLDSIKQEQP